MSKFTDAVLATLQGYFDAGDQPTEAQFDALILAIQEGIEEKILDGTGDGDSSVAQTGILMADDGWIGIGAALERIVFDTTGYVSVMGADFGVGTLTPDLALDVTVGVDNDGIQIRNTLTAAASYSVLQFAFGVAGDTARIKAIKPDLADVRTQLQLLVHSGTAWMKGIFLESNGRVGFNIDAAIAGQVHIDQPVNDAAIPVLVLDQADLSEGFVNFLGTSAASAVGPISTWTTGGAIQGFVRVEINNAAHWMPYYSAPTS